MRRICALFLLLVFLPVVAFAEYDLKSLTDEELHALIEEANQELNSRSSVNIDKTIDSNAFFKAEAAMTVLFDLDPDISSLSRTTLDNHCFISYFDGIRLLFYDDRIAKASALMDFDNTTDSIIRMYYLVSIFEGELFKKDSLSADDKHKAVYAAKEIVDTAVDLFGDNMVKVAMSGQEGFQLLAATGVYIYHWEYINKRLWLSIEFTDLPDGIN